MSQGPLMLVIRDGWGISLGDPKIKGDAIAAAATPTVDTLLATHPVSQLICHGEAVGLPAGQMGNSEVGHLNLGAGRTVYQELTRISRAISDESFYDVPAFTKIVANIKERGSRLHFIGLCSDGGVHSHLDHLLALLELARRGGLENSVVHCLLDGRDTSPTAGINYITQIQEVLDQHGGAVIGTLIGRYYAMDRDNRWDRVAAAHACLVHGQGEMRDDPITAMQTWYADQKTDEFIPPTIIQQDGQRHIICDGDGIIFFNFRADRAREITRALVQEDFDGFDRGPALNVDYVCLTEYDEQFQLPVAFPPNRMTNLLGDILSAHDLKQLRIAETEKYPHVTFFFNGGEETPAVGEVRCLVPSPQVATYDLQPEMSAPEVTRQLIEHLESGIFDVVIINYANPDMVGHTGSIPAATKAVETIDGCLGQVLAKLSELGGRALITADHGNAEQMLAEDGSPHTAHTTNPVHLIYHGPDKDQIGLVDGSLPDIAPTMLDLLGLPIPKEMTGHSLLQRSPS